MTIIAAMGANRVIGSGAGMPWSVPDEYAQFLRLVEGQTVVIGRRSWQIFGEDLTSAHNVVVSRSLRELEGAVVVNGVETALELARGFGRKVFCAGGARIYEQMLPLAEEMYLSIVKGDFDGDAFFPEFDEADWKIASREQHPDFDFLVYRRR